MEYISSPSAFELALSTCKAMLSKRLKLTDPPAEETSAKFVILRAQDTVALVLRVTKGILLPLLQDEKKRAGSNAPRITIIAVTPKSVSSIVREDAMEIMREASFARLQWFTHAELSFDITEHELVFPHRVMSEEEAAAMLQRRKMKRGDLPKLLKTDPVARFYGMQENQVVEIKRMSLAVGVTVIYRCVHNK